MYQENKIIIRQSCLWITQHERAYTWKQFHYQSCLWLLHVTLCLLDDCLLHEVNHEARVPELVGGRGGNGGIQGHLHLPVGVTEHFTKLVLQKRQWPSISTSHCKKMNLCLELSMFLINRIFFNLNFSIFEFCFIFNGFYCILIVSCCSPYNYNVIIIIIIII